MTVSSQSLSNGYVPTVPYLALTVTDWNPLPIFAFHKDENSDDFDKGAQACNWLDFLIGNCFRLEGQIILTHISSRVRLVSFLFMISAWNSATHSSFMTVLE